MHSRSTPQVAFALLAGALLPFLGVGAAASGAVTPAAWVVQVAVPPSFKASAVAAGPDGSLHIGSPGAPGASQLLHVLSDGSTDPSFGVGGIAQVAVPPGGMHLLVDSAGRIIVVGSGQPGTVVERLTSTGHPDLAYGTNGAATIPRGDILNAAELDPAGGVFVAVTESSTGTALVTHLLASGATDTAFNHGEPVQAAQRPSLAPLPGGGVAVVGILGADVLQVLDASGNTSTKTQLSPDPGRTLVVAFTRGEVDIVGVNGVGRFTLDGMLDTTFASGRCGRLTPMAGTAIFGFQGIEGLPTVGLSSGGYATALSAGVSPGPVIVRDADAVPDTRAGVDGVITTSSGRPVLATMLASGQGLLFGVSQAGGNPILAVAKTIVPPSGPQGPGAPSGEGIAVIASDGGVFTPAGATTAGGVFCGSTGATRLNSPIVGGADVPGGYGYWLAGADGGIFSFGDAVFRGSTGALHLNRPIVGMAATPSGRGYWLVASDGGVFSFGDATFHGSTGAAHLNRPIVGMAPTPGGAGYWLVASDGGIFSFGDAVFRGSTGAIHLNQPVVGMAATSSGGGYWLVASDGGVFSFGDAMFIFSTAAGSSGPPGIAKSGNSRTVGISRTAFGYLLASADGQVCGTIPIAFAVGGDVTGIGSGSCYSPGPLASPAVGVSGA